MIIRDAIYGGFEIPTYLEALVLAPEFRRLSEVRLININSASLSSLADVRRYSHTLGVLRLALLNPLLGLGEEEVKAFFASIIIHDVGTPAFAHLFEYFLSERFGWDHEGAIGPLVSQSDQQIFHALEPRFRRLCGQAGIEFEIVNQFITQAHPYHRLIFGSLDFDNLDNVIRMNWMLGEEVSVSQIYALARALGVNSHGELVLSTSSRPDVRHWLALRKRAYEILVYDGPTVAGQAVLSRAIRDALDEQTLDQSDWAYTDSDLVDVLLKNSATKVRMHRDFLTKPPDLLLLATVSDGELMRSHRASVASSVEDFLERKFNRKGFYGYAFRDKGAFSKRVDFICPLTGERWSEGQASDSLIIYGFGDAPKNIGKPDQLGQEFRDWMTR